MSKTNKRNRKSRQRRIERRGDNSFVSVSDSEQPKGEIDFRIESLDEWVEKVVEKPVEQWSVKELKVYEFFEKRNDMFTLPISEGHKTKLEQLKKKWNEFVGLFVGDYLMSGYSNLEDYLVEDCGYSISRILDKKERYEAMLSHFEGRIVV